MEIMSLKVKGDGFKVTPQWLKAVGIDLENWPTLPEALKAKKEADILLHQKLGLFLSNPVKWVLKSAECNHNQEHSETIRSFYAFSYGYILGKRAERARRKKAKQS